jgi:hypothetical protein
LRCINCGAMVNIRILRNLVAQHAEGLTLAGQTVPRSRRSEGPFTMQREL